MALQRVSVYIVKRKGSRWGGGNVRYDVNFKVGYRIKIQ